MLAFPLFRSQHRLSMNYMSYIGMAGDLVVAVALFSLWKLRKSLKQAGAAKKKEISENENLYVHI